MSEQVPIRIQGDPDVVAELAEVLREESYGKVDRIDEDDAADVGLDFALETVATLVGIANVLFFDKAIVPTLWNYFKKRTGHRLTIETPTRTITIESTGDLSEEKLQQAIAALIAP